LDFEDCSELRTLPKRNIFSETPGWLLWWFSVHTNKDYVITDPWTTTAELWLVGLSQVDIVSAQEVKQDWDWSPWIHWTRFWKQIHGKCLSDSQTIYTTELSVFQFLEYKELFKNQSVQHNLCMRSTIFHY